MPLVLYSLGRWTSHASQTAQTYTAISWIYFLPHSFCHIWTIFWVYAHRWFWNPWDPWSLYQIISCIWQQIIFGSFWPFAFSSIWEVRLILVYIFASIFRFSSSSFMLEYIHCMVRNISIGLMLSVYCIQNYCIQFRHIQLSENI